MVIIVNGVKHQVHFDSGEQLKLPYQYIIELAGCLNPFANLEVTCHSRYGKSTLLPNRYVVVPHDDTPTFCVNLEPVRHLSRYSTKVP